MKESIKKAIEGGYVTGFMYDKLAAIDPLHAWEILLLDPKWWQALGKSLNWGDGWGEMLNEEGWKHHWHRFIDHLAEGKDAESFFIELLK